MWSDRGNEHCVQRVGVVCAQRLLRIYALESARASWLLGALVVLSAMMLDCVSGVRRMVYIPPGPAHMVSHITQATFHRSVWLCGFGFDAQWCVMFGSTKWRSGVGYLTRWTSKQSQAGHGWRSRCRRPAPRASACRHWAEQWHSAPKQLRPLPARAACSNAAPS